MTQKTDLTTGSIKSHLARTSIPMAFGLIAIISFQIVDTYFIAQLGENQLTAISFTFPITYLLFSIMMGIGIGTSSVLSRLIGQNEHQNVKIITTQILCVATIMTAIMSVIGLQIIEPLFKTMGASTTLLTYIKQYMDLWFIGLVCISLPLIGNAAIRSTGDSTLPGIIMVTAAFVNIILDPILIFGLLGVPKLGIQGAALATIAANIIALLAGLYILTNKKHMIQLSALIQWNQYKTTIKKIFHVGIPAAISNIIAPLSSAILIAIVANYSEEAVAAFGVASRIEAFLFIPMMALSVGLSPIVGQNWGAQNIKRVHNTTQLALKICVLWGLIAALIMAISGHVITSLFTDNENIIEIATYYMLIIPITYGLANATNLWCSTYNAMGMPKRALIINATKMLAIYLPFSYIGGELYGIHGILYGMASAYILTGITFHLWNQRHHKQIEKEALNQAS